ncbi:MAG: hypothetical protein ACXVQZ_04990 [Gaiellaceae bacterium]
MIHQLLHNGLIVVGAAAILLYAVAIGAARTIGSRRRRRRVMGSAVPYRTYPVRPPL